MKKAILSVAAILALLGAGCGNDPVVPTQPLIPVAPTNTITPEVPKPTEPAPDANFSNAIWKNYTDNQLGYSLNYPVLDASKTWSPSSGDLDLSAFPKVEHRERRLSVTAKKSTTPITCSKEIEVKNQAGITFCVTRSTEGAAGSTYGTYAYRGLVNGVLLTLTFVERHPSDPRIIEGCEDGTSAAAKCQTFDSTRDVKIFGEIINRIAPAAISDQVSFTTAEINKKKDKIYEVKVLFPQMDKGDALLGAAFNAAIRDPLEKEANELIKQALQAELDKVISINGYSLLMEPLATYQSSRLINSFITGSVYSGGAHPNAIYQNVIMDRLTRKSLRVSDLFKDPKQGLAFLSSASFKSLKAKDLFKSASADDWLKTGTSPKDENFSQTHLTPNGLTVLFPPYQVAAYVAGPQEVEIPWKDVQGLIKTEYLPTIK